MEKNIKKNVVLFAVTFLIGMMLTAGQSNLYRVFIHEMNHLFAGLLTGNVPVYFSLNPGMVSMIGVGIARSQFVRDFISVSGAGLAFGSPAIVLYLGYKIKHAGIAGFWIPGSVLVIQDWGYGADFDGIGNLGLWAFFLVLFTIFLYVIVVLLISYEIGRKENATKHTRQTDCRRCINKQAIQQAIT